MHPGRSGSDTTIHNDRWWNLLVLLIPVAVKCAFLRPDQLFEAHTAALDLVATGQFGHHYFGSWDRAFQFPVYTAMLGLLYLFGGGMHIALFFQVVCGTLVAYLCQKLVIHLLHTHRHVHVLGRITALLIGLDPFLAYYQVRMVHPFAWDMLLATGLLYLALVAEPARRRSVIVLFALAGLALLNRPTLGVLLLPFALRHPRLVLGRSDALFKLSLSILLLGPIGCWALRNHLLTGRFQLTSVTDQMVWMGQQEETEGGAYQADGRTYLHLLSIPERHLMFELDPGGRSDLFRAKWKAERKADPFLAWRMLGVKLKNFWLWRNGMGQDHDARLHWAKGLYRVHAAILSLLAMASLIIGDRRARYVGFAVLLLSIIQCTFYVETRHRLLVDPVLYVLTITAAARVGDRLTSQSGSKAAGYLRPTDPTP